MALFDFITGIKDKLPQYGNIAAELGTPQTYSNGGELAVQALKPTLFNRITGLGDKIYDGLFGKIVDNSGVNDGTLSATINNPHREGGFLNDLQSGFNENLTTRFAPQNLVGNGGSLARKIGEGFGTALRFADSPLGRGVLVGGAIGALGGTPAEMAAYGLGTTALNQGNRTADKLYRDNLAEQGIDTSNLKGYLNDDIYRNISLNNYRMNNTLNNEVRDVIKLLQNGSISPEQASAYLQSLGYDFGNMGYSNQTINTQNKSKILPYQIENLEARTENIKNPKPKKIIHESTGKGGKPDNKGGNGTNEKDETKPIGAGTTKSGVKYRVVE